MQMIQVKFPVEAPDHDQIKAYLVANEWKKVILSHRRNIWRKESAFGGADYIVASEDDPLWVITRLAEVEKRSEYDVYISIITLDRPTIEIEKVD